MKAFKPAAVIFVAVLFSAIPFFSVAQSHSSDLQILDEATRALQLYGKYDSLASLCIRPVRGVKRLSFDSSGKLNGTFSTFTDYTSQSSSVFRLLPVELKQQFNSHHPYGWNDGSMIPAKGYQAQLGFGIFLKKGFVSLQLRPEIVYAQNGSFSTFPSQHSDEIWRAYYNTVINVTDAPERFGAGSYTKIFPGQSALRFNYRKLSLGISTENLWWGPGVRNSLIMSNNAPGFPHLSFNSSQPLTSRVGSFEWQVISGVLKSSDILPDDTTRTANGQALYVPKQEDGDRYLNGVVFTWQPTWTKGLFLGFSRMYYQYVSDVPFTIDGYMPVIGKLFKGGLKNEDEKKRDQMISVFFRLVLPKEKAELYGEFGRNDHAQNARDLLVEPEHSRAYILGFAKWFEGRKKDIQLFGEITNLQMPATIRLRAQESWYSHYQVRHGYTNYGQVVGAGIGPGGASQTIGLQWGEGLQRFGGTIERVVNNNDFYYTAFSASEQWQRHWVDFSLNLNKSFLKKRMLYDARLSLVHSMNYQWSDKDVTQLSARLTVAYLF
jgi:hypothetical protein